MSDIFHPNLYFIFEALAFSAYALILVRAVYHKNKTAIFEILSCTVFGLILEIGNTYLAHTYYYSPNFLIKIFNVPLAIGCGWAVIIYCVMLLSDQYNLPWKIRPFFDALTALLLDLSMDAIAIRLGFWHWSIPLNQEWYGVPFENLFGWFMVVLSFSFLARIIRRLDGKKISVFLIKIFSPFLYYLILLLGLAVFGFITIAPYHINHWHSLLNFNYRPDISIIYDSQVQLWKLIFLMIIGVELVNIVAWALVKYRRSYLMHFDLLSFFILSAVHLFFIIVLFTSGLYLEIPILIFIGLFMFIVHCLLHFLPFLIHPRTIYFFQKIQSVVEKERAKITEIIERI